MLRERVEKYSGTLSDYELLATAVGVREVKTEFHIRELSYKNLQEIEEIPGVGPGIALRIKACLELAKRFPVYPLTRGRHIARAQEVFEIYNERLRAEMKEFTYALLLSSKNRILSEELISVGTLNTSLVHPREVFAPAIKRHAASMLLVHNHPSGDPTPSQEDILITKRLVEVGKLVGIDVIDHIIIGDGCYVSLSHENLM